ncbi:MAG: SRPBCC family protein [Pseudomonadota bacterium]
MLCCMLAAGGARAGAILDSSVTLAQGVYRIAVDARIAAPVATVYARITDYDHLSRINHAIETSHVLRTDSPTRHRVRSVIKACVLFFCRRVHQVQDMTQDEGSRIEAHILPQQSDFHAGHALWRLEPAGTDTLMHFRAQLEPAFWVPPLIGPWLFERKIVSELLESAAVIERDWRAGLTP